MLVIVDQPTSIRALPLAVARAIVCQVAYLLSSTRGSRASQGYSRKKRAEGLTRPARTWSRKALEALKL